MAHRDGSLRLAAVWQPPSGRNCRQFLCKIFALPGCHAATDVSGPPFSSNFKGQVVPESFKSRTCCAHVRTLP